MKNRKLFSLAFLFSTLVSSSLVYAQETQPELKAPKEKRLNLTPSILDVVKSHNGTDKFRVYVNQVIINTGVVVLSENQFVDHAVHSEYDGQRVGERTDKMDGGKIIASEGDNIYVSFDKSCVSKACSYHFEPNKRGVYTLTTSPEQGEQNNGAKVTILGISIPDIIAPEVKLQYLETDVRNFSSDIRENQGW